MRYRSLGNSGLKVSAIGLGCNQLGATAQGDQAIAVVHAALDQGITFLDTADMYVNGLSEEIVGRAVQGRRGDAIIGTKVGKPMGGQLRQGLSRRWIMQAIEESLRRLQTDYVDLYTAHEPDPETPLEETLRAFDDLVRQGKVRYIGCSNFQAWQLAKAHGIGARDKLSEFIAVENEWNILRPLEDPTLLAACSDLGVGIIPYRPLASGVLTGKYRADQPPPTGTRLGDSDRMRTEYSHAEITAVHRLSAWAERRGHTTTEIAIGALLSYPHVSTVIIGARSPEQVIGNARVADVSVSEAERDETLGLLQGGER